MVTEDGIQTGIVTDVINTLDIPSIQFEQKVLPFKRMIKSMSLKKDPWISYGSAAWPGPQSTSLSKTPIINVSHVFLTLNDTAYTSIEDLFGKTIVIIRGFDYPGLEPYFKNGIISGFEVKTHKQAIEAVLKNRAAAFPEMRFRLAYHLKKNDVESSKVKLSDISDVIPDYAINLCFSKTFPRQARLKIESRLKQMQLSDELQDILNNYIR